MNEEERVKAAGEAIAVALKMFGVHFEYDGFVDEDIYLVADEEYEMPSESIN